MFAEHHRGKTHRAPDVPQNAAGLNKMSKSYWQTLTFDFATDTAQTLIWR